MEITWLLSKRQALLIDLSKLLYGSIEIREKCGKKYVYVHYREDGIKQTKYAGAYSEELHNLIISNSIKAKTIKKELRAINKRLSDTGYKPIELPLDVQKNIDFARRHLADTIYKQAVLEGIATTFADTETIIEGGKVHNMKAEDVLKLLNLKHAWEFVLNEGVVQTESSFAILSQINKFVLEGFYYNAGEIRTTPVSIGGTLWKPPLPIESELKDQLKEILNSRLRVVDKAIEILLFVMKKQIFIDGNKRSAVVFANHFLIQNAGGLIVIPDTRIDQYKTHLLEYYEGKDLKTIKQFLKDFAYKKY